VKWFPFFGQFDVLWSSNCRRLEEGHAACVMISNTDGQTLVGYSQFGNYFKLCVNLKIDLVRVPSTIVGNR